MCHGECACPTSAGLCTGQERVLDPLELELFDVRGCWEVNCCSLKEQQFLLTPARYCQSSRSSLSSGLEITASICRKDADSNDYTLPNIY